MQPSRSAGLLTAEEVQWQAGRPGDRVCDAMLPGLLNMPELDACAGCSTLAAIKDRHDKGVHLQMWLRLGQQGQLQVQLGMTSWWLWF